MRMKSALQLKLSQHLALTPQLQQSIRLLQLSTVELNEELERFLMENPLLEWDDTEPDAIPRDAEASPGEASAAVGDDPPSEEVTDAGADAIEDYGESFSRDDDSEQGFAVAAEPSLQQHLEAQLGLIALSERDRRIAGMLIGMLDDDGYLTVDLDDVRAAMPADWGVEIEEVQIALRHVQQLEPTGVGARSLAECLELQLAAMPPVMPHRAEAIALVRQHLDLLAQRDFLKLRRSLHVDQLTLREIQTLVVSLDPKPGRCFGAGEVRYVTPDVIVRKTNGKWQVSLNRDAIPRLRVNRLYADLVRKSRNGDGKNLSGPLQEARWLIKNIQQRFDTIRRVSEAIVENQRHFFDHGEVAMRPLVLREVADQVGLHESTVSRVTTQKYMLTPRGLFELKYFFGSSLATEAGGACSSTAIRALIKQLIDAEDKRKPLSDNKIADILSEQGILVARRTVAKYREGMLISPTNQRKTI